MLLIGWLTLFDKRIGVPDTGDWFEEPPNKEDEEELVPIFRTTSETRKNYKYGKTQKKIWSNRGICRRLIYILRKRRFDHFLGLSYVNSIVKQ